MAGITFEIDAEKSHADHLNDATMSVVREIMRDGQSRPLVVVPGFQIHEVDLPDHLPAVPCALRGPTTGEAPVQEHDVFYGTRGGRPNISRLTALPATTDRRVTVIVVGVNEDGTRGTLATAYGGPLAPQEPGDPFLVVKGEDGAVDVDATAKKHASAVAFWAEHALSVDGSPDATRVEAHSFAKFSAPAPTK